MAKRHVHVLVEGRVQGVYFRAYTRDKAEELQLDGWVRNLVDGRVEASLEGEATAVAGMLEWLSHGSPHAVVSSVIQRELPLTGELRPFTILPTSARPMAPAASF